MTKKKATLLEHRNLAVSVGGGGLRSPLLSGTNLVLEHCLSPASSFHQLHTITIYQVRQE